MDEVREDEKIELKVVPDEPAAEATPPTVAQASAHNPTGADVSAPSSYRDWRKKQRAGRSKPSRLTPATVLMLVIGALMVAFPLRGIYETSQHIRKEEAIVKHSEVTTGTVSRVQELRNNEKRYAVDFKTPSGEQYWRWVWSVDLKNHNLPPELKMNDKVQMHYLAEDPKFSFMEGNLNAYDKSVDIGKIIFLSIFVGGGIGLIGNAMLRFSGQNPNSSFSTRAINLISRGLQAGCSILMFALGLSYVWPAYTLLSHQLASGIAVAAIAAALILGSIFWLGALWTSAKRSKATDSVIT